MGVCESKEQKEQREAEHRRWTDMFDGKVCQYCNKRPRYTEGYSEGYGVDNHMYLCRNKPIVPAIYEEVKVCNLEDVLRYFISKRIIPINCVRYYRNIKLVDGELRCKEYYNDKPWLNVGLSFDNHVFAYYIDRYRQKPVPFAVHTGLNTLEWREAVNDITNAMNYDRKNIVPFLCMKIGTVVITLTTYQEIDEFLDRLRPFVFPEAKEASPIPPSYTE